MFGLTKRVLVLDTETSSAVDLKKAGAHRYFANRSTRTLMVGFREVGAPMAQVWQPHLGAPPRYLRDALEAPPEECLIAGYNMAFDGMAMDKLGRPVPLEKQLDIALLSYMLGFAGTLDQVRDKGGPTGPGIAEFGLQQSSLEEVFIKIVRGAERQ